MKVRHCYDKSTEETIQKKLIHEKNVLSIGVKININYVSFYLLHFIIKSIPEIRQYINDNYYPMDFTLDSIRDSYEFDVSCQGTVPPAIMAFLESTDFEDAIRNSISIGGDSDTIAAIAGGIAGAYYGVPTDIREQALAYMDRLQRKILLDFEAVLGIS